MGGSSLNFTTGQTIGNLNITKASPQGDVTYRASVAGTTDLIVDIAGYYTSGA